MSKNTLFSVVLPLSLLGCIGLFAFAGCGGGAESDVSVAFKPAEEEDIPVEPPIGPGGTTLPPVPQGAPGVFAGKVSFKGSFAGLAPLIQKGDVAAAKGEVCSAETVPNESLVVGEANGIKDVFVYLDKVKLAGTKRFIAASKAFKDVPLPEDAIVFNQQVCTFLPHAMVVRVKQPIKVWNSDGAAHNTHTKPNINSEFNSVVNPNDNSGDVSFSYGKEEKEPVSVVCDFHSWMKAYHLPLSHPYAAVTAADGTFEIKDLPPGSYQFRLWHSGQFLERKVAVEIKDGAATKMDFSYSIDKLSAGK